MTHMLIPIIRKLVTNQLMSFPYIKNTILEMLLLLNPILISHDRKQK